MRLSQVHTEGVFINSYRGLDPSSVLTAKEGGGKKRGGGKGGGGLTDLYMDREYHYREEDHPEDLVHLQPLNKVVSLPTVPDDPHALRSFQGVKIHYAFTVVPTEGFTDDAVRGGWQLPPNFMQLVKELRKLNGMSMWHQGIAKRDWKPIDTDADLHNRLDRIRSREQYVTHQMGGMSHPRLEDELTELKRERELIEQMLGFMQQLKMHSIEELEADEGGQFSYTSNEKEKTVTRREFTSSHLNYAAQSLARKIKNPTSQGEREMSYKLTEAAAVNLARLYAPFDLIVLPSSSASYNNETLIPLIKQQNGWGAVPVIQLSKLTGDQALDEIDVGSLVHRAEQYHERAVGGEKIHPGLVINPKQLALITSQIGGVPMPQVDPTAPLSPLNPAWIEWWVAGKVALMKKILSQHLGRPVPIKALTDIDQYKKYVQLFTASPQDLAVIKDKRVLIVDDNVNHTATMQMIHALVKKGSPKEVLIYTPFYMGG